MVLHQYITEHLRALFSSDASRLTSLPLDLRRHIIAGMLLYPSAAVYSDATTEILLQRPMTNTVLSGYYTLRNASRFMSTPHGVLIIDMFGYIHCNSRGMHIPEPNVGHASVREWYFIYDNEYKVARWNRAVLTTFTVDTERALLHSETQMIILPGGCPVYEQFPYIVDYQRDDSGRRVVLWNRSDRLCMLRYTSESGRNVYANTRYISVPRQSVSICMESIDACLAMQPWGEFVRVAL